MYDQKHLVIKKQLLIFMLCAVVIYLFSSSGQANPLPYGTSIDAYQQEGTQDVKIAIQAWEGGCTSGKIYRGKKVIQGEYGEVSLDFNDSSTEVVTEVKPGDFEQITHHEPYSNVDFYSFEGTFTDKCVRPGTYYYALKGDNCSPYSSEITYNNPVTVEEIDPSCFPEEGGCSINHVKFYGSKSSRVPYFLIFLAGTLFVSIFIWKCKRRIKKTK